MVMTEPTDAEVEALIEANPNGCTLEMIGAAMGVTKARAQQILNTAIGKVKRALGARGIRRIDDIAPSSTTDSLSC